MYPVEPIIRHGAAVRVEKQPDATALLEETVHTIRKWQQDGYETIAVICREEKEAAVKLAEQLKSYMEIVDCNPGDYGIWRRCYGAFGCLHERTGV